MIEPGESAPRGPGAWFQIAVCGVLALALIIPALSAVSRPLFSSGRPLPKIQLVDNPQPAPPQPAEQWGGGSPTENCDECTLESLLGTAGGESTKPGQEVNPATGDFTTDLTPVTIPAIGGSLEVKLTYDSQRGVAQAIDDNDNLNAGLFGYGWTSSITSSLSPLSNNVVTVDEENGSQVTFTVPSHDGCPYGDYQDFQKYTLPSSLYAFCAPSRVDAQLADYGPYGYQLQEQGGQLLDAYDPFGRLAATGTPSAPNNLAFTYPGTGQPIFSNQPNGPKCTANLYCLVEQDVSGQRYLIGQVVGTQNQLAQMANVTVNATAGSLGEGVSFGYDTKDDLNSVQLLAGPANPQWRYNYTTAWTYPYDHQMYQDIDPNNNVQAIGYYQTTQTGQGQGMVNYVTDQAGNTTNQVTYSHYEQNTCATIYGCLSGDQQVQVNYADGEQDTDHYVTGVLAGALYGSPSTGSSQQLGWSFNHNYPPPSNQNGWTTETIVLPTQNSSGQNYTATVVTDPTGNVVSYTDPNGNTTNEMYNDTGGNNYDELCWSARPGVTIPSDASCTNPPAGSTTYTYDSFGHKLSETDPQGNTTRMGYYSNGLDCWEAEATVTGTGSACTGNTPNGAPVGSDTYTYDLYGDVTQKVVATGTGSSTQQTTTTCYDFNSRPTFEIPPNGQGQGGCGANPYETAKSYYQDGLLQAETEPLGRTTSYTYDAAGNELTKTDPAGVTTAAYDGDNRECWSFRSSSAISQSPCSSPPAASVHTNYLFDTKAPTSVTDQNGNTTSYTYADPAYPTDATTVTDPMGSEVQYAVYDAYGNVCISGPVNPYAAGTPICPTQPGSPYPGDKSKVYDADGNLTAATDESGNTTTYLYTNPGYPDHVTSETNPLNKTTSFTYDPDGHEVTATDPEGHTLSTGYDANERPCWQAPTTAGATCSSPPTGTGASVFTYNADDNRIQRIDNNGTPQQTTATFSYDLNNNLTATTDSNGRTISYTYDQADEVTCVAYPAASGSNCSNPASASNTVVNRTYDGSGRLSSVTDWLGNTTTYSNYDAYSRLGTITYPASTGESLNYSYDGAGNLLKAAYAGPLRIAGSATQDTFTPNPDEQVAASTGLDGNNSASDTYDSYKRVSQASDPLSSGGSTSHSFAYNPNGTIATDTPSGGQAISYSYNAGSELTSVVNPNAAPSAQDSSFAYTDDGQRCWTNTATSLVNNPSCSSPPSGATSYGWNVFGQLCWSAQTTNTSAPCSAPPSGATTYSYDGDGLRMTEDPGGVSSSTELFSWDTVDGGKIPLAIDDQTSNQSSGNSYIYGLLLFGGTAPVEQISASGQVSFLASTPSGVQAVFTNPSNGVDTLTEQAAYSTYGMQTIQSGSKATPFGFQGSYTDPSGLIYLINRYYDPSTDQFISVDPQVDATDQPYVFAGDNPLNSTDPLGTCPRHHRCPQGHGHGPARRSAPRKVMRQSHSARHAVARTVRHHSGPAKHASTSNARSNAKHKREEKSLPCGSVCEGVFAVAALRPHGTAAEARAALAREGVDTSNYPVATPTRKNDGWVFRQAGRSPGDSEIRVMDASSSTARRIPGLRYGYWAFTNESGQLLDKDLSAGNPLGAAATHFPLSPPAPEEHPSLWTELERNFWTGVENEGDG